MKRETIKTIILSLLVLISLLFTFNIWGFQGNYEKVEDSQAQVSDKQPITNQTKLLNEAVKPQQMFIHENGQHYLLNDTTLYSQLWDDMSRWEVKSLKDISDKFDRQQFKNWLYAKNKESKLDLVFSDNIPIDVLQPLFKWSANSYEYNSFDRIVLPFNEGRGMKKIYFVSFSKETVVEAVIESANYRNILSDIEKEKTQMPLYEDFAINSRRDVLLPVNRLKLSEKEYFTETISPTRFKKALFDDPQTVRQETNLNRPVYTDGTSLLEVYSNNRQIKFQHRNLEPSSSYQNGELINKSFKYLNDTGSWTDDYQFFGLNENQQINFNLFMDQLPVVNSQNQPFGTTSIELRWANNDILDYKHPTYVLGANANPVSKTDKEIMSGEELIQFLQENEEYDFEKIEQIFPAYEMVSVSEEQDPLVKLVPTWCIKINGTIKPVSKKDSAVKEGIENGVE
ncbi:YycH family regulatory protein [Bacillus haynesii]|uniref:YycH family regulatory protein n=1 Tax=Bacillus haynesii TaxID=1925021 RepID=UPI001F60A67A|nr:two-component system activity regulator YycH [Bacillus haynesii]MCI4127756.1 two-component system activity regulator YycH [Bacillus haynesii]